MSRLIPYLLLCIGAAVLPLFAGSSALESSAQAFPGWPTQLEGQLLKPLLLSEKERLFVRDFPGRIQRFSDGRREYILRWVFSPTRKLHPASDCLRGVGFSISPLPLATRPDGAKWSQFQASRGKDSLSVYERIYDNAGNSWSDVSAWYWAALLGKSAGPWWSVVIAEK
jgi:hypothetical protein